MGIRAGTMVIPITITLASGMFLWELAWPDLITIILPVISEFMEAIVTGGLILIIVSRIISLITTLILPAVIIIRPFILPLFIRLLWSCHPIPQFTSSNSLCVLCRPLNRPRRITGTIVKTLLAIIRRWNAVPVAG